jgi:hypothetical protein
MGNNITELHYVNNFSSTPLLITNFENGFTRTCPGNASTFVSYQWVPWCSKGSDYPTRHIDITFGGATHSMWQDRDTDGDFVRHSLTNTFTRSDFPPFSPAPHFPGSALAGGDHSIEVSTAGVVTLRFILT